MKKVFMFFAAVAALASCAKENPVTENPVSEPQEVTIEAVAATTKTQLVDGTNVQWTPGDKIKMCFDVQPNFSNKRYGPTAEFESQGSEVSEKTYFKGSINMANAGAYGFVAYPSTISFESSGVTWSDFKTNVSYDLSSSQPAADNTFAPNLNLSWAAVTKTEVNNNASSQSPINVTFKNMCALIKVTLPAEEYNVNNILIESTSAGLTGDRSLTWVAESSKQELMLGNFKSAVNEVSLANADGSNLTAGASYYAVVWPGQHNGLTFTFTDENGLVCVKNLNKTVNCEVGKITEINVKTLEFKEAEPELTVSTSAMNFVADGGYNTFTFNTNKNWTATVSSNQAWCTIDKKSGVAGDNTIAVTCSAHTDYTKTRSADITIYAGGLTHVVKVTQDAAKKTISLAVSTSNISVAGQGGTASFTVTCNDNWTITDIPEWLTFSQTSGTENASAVTVNVTVKQNFFYNSKNKSVAIKAGDIIKYISFSQGAVQSYKIGDAVSKAGDMQDGQPYIIMNNSDQTKYWSISSGKLQYEAWPSQTLHTIRFAFVYHRDDSKGKSSDNRYNSVSTGAWQACHTEYYMADDFYFDEKTIDKAVFVANSNRWGSDTGSDIDMCQIGSANSIAWNGSKYLWGSTSEGNRKWLVYKAVPQY